MPSTPSKASRSLPSKASRSDSPASASSRKAGGGAVKQGQVVGYNEGTMDTVMVDADAYRQAKTVMVANPKVNPWAILVLPRFYLSCWKNSFWRTVVGHLVLLSFAQVGSGVIMGVASTAQGTAVKVDASNTGSVAAGITQVGIKTFAPAAQSVGQNAVLPVAAPLAGASYNAPASNAIAPGTPAPVTPGVQMIGNPGQAVQQPGISWGE
ncbi:MAG: hypothetical protein F6K65_30405 [Moorea sp. SIO3C2]|nr:hypothetical protein [Moorena sp. SIO3C2]